MVIKIDTITDIDKYKGKLKGKIVMTDVKGYPEQTFRADASRLTDSALTAMANATPVVPGTGSPRRGGPGGPFTPARIQALLALRTAITNLYVSEGVGLVLSQGRGTDGTVFTTNGASYADTAHAVAPELETSSEDYQRILRLSKAGIKVQLEADIKTEFFTNDLQGYDVVGEIPVPTLN
ncbi:hypothetical protein [Mucilaginibacter humi]|uniref:hypothetical protein n=1 Tax=Mucilaginibacter humi TaxID=2732510 RepID=UPI001C2EC221|nr:hypothetical protein [Mucilaginibacter humi]